MAMGQSKRQKVSSSRQRKSKSRQQSKMVTSTLLITNLKVLLQTLMQRMKILILERRRTIALMDSVGRDLNWKHLTMSTISAGEVWTQWEILKVNLMVSLQLQTTSFMLCTSLTPSTMTQTAQIYRSIFFSQLSATPRSWICARWSTITEWLPAPETL